MNSQSLKPMILQFLYAKLFQYKCTLFTVFSNLLSGSHPVTYMGLAKREKAIAKKFTKLPVIS